MWSDPRGLTRVFSVLTHDLTQPFNPCLSSTSLRFPLPAIHLNRTLPSAPTQDIDHVCTVYLIHWWPQNLLLTQALRKNVQSEGTDSQKFYLTCKLVVTDSSMVKSFYRLSRSVLRVAEETGGQNAQTSSKPVVFQTSLQGSLEMLQGFHRGQGKDKQARFQGINPASTRVVLLLLWCVYMGFTQDFIWQKSFS